MADEKDDVSGLYAEVREVSETTPTARFHMDEKKSYISAESTSCNLRVCPQRSALASDGVKNVFIALVVTIVLVLAVAACCV